jgi:hypothetical protein
MIIFTRAQVTAVSVSGPNLSGTRVSTGKKYNEQLAGVISVALIKKDP